MARKAKIFLVIFQKIRIIFPTLIIDNGEFFISGSISGGRQVGKATYIPANYAKAQNQWIESFYAQNGYLEYDALVRLGLSDPKNTIKRKFPEEKLTFLSSCCIGDNVRNIVEIQIEEALSSQSFVDIVMHLPSVISQEDASTLLTGKDFYF